MNGSSAGPEIVLLPGKTKAVDRIGHHDYAGGCALLADLLAQTTGVRAAIAPDGWPGDDSVLETARALVVYASGGGKQPIVQSAERVARMRDLIARGVGLVTIHQAVSYPADLAPLAADWLGGAHVSGESGRGHWRTHHRDFPKHPVTRGVRPWEIRDGWLNEVRFADAEQRITPLLWSGRKHRGSSAGGRPDVVAWAFERPDGGRSFSFSGLDAHSAWSVDGVRQLIVNGILWSAGREIPDAGAPCAIGAQALAGYLTPRRPRGAVATVLRGARRFFG